MAKKEIIGVKVHPLVLLSVVDHYTRPDGKNTKRVVGCLLGHTHNGYAHAVNSFAVPFEETRKPLTKESSPWFLNFTYLEDMYEMFNKVNSREKIIGWYSSGPEIQGLDKDIHRLFSELPQLSKSADDLPVYLIVKVHGRGSEIPCQAYKTMSVVREDGTNDMEFKNLVAEIEQSEPEEMSTEHLLRDTADTSHLQSLNNQVMSVSNSMRSLKGRLGQIQGYLESVESGKLPADSVNHLEIMENLQQIVNLLPNVNTPLMVQSFNVKNNDQMLALYMAHIVRTVQALDRLIENKRLEKGRQKEAKDKVAENEKTKKEKREKESESGDKMDVDSKTDNKSADQA